VVSRRAPAAVPNAYVLQVTSEGAKARAEIPAVKFPLRLSDHDGAIPLKKLLVRHILSVPAIKTSSLARHFSNREIKGALVLSSDSGVFALVKVAPPLMVLLIPRF
jgi:hypothetical protein